MDSAISAARSEKLARKSFYISTLIALGALLLSILQYYDSQQKEETIEVLSTKVQKIDSLLQSQSRSGQGSRSVQSAVDSVESAEAAQHAADSTHSVDQ